MSDTTSDLAVAARIAMFWRRFQHLPASLRLILVLFVVAPLGFLGLAAVNGQAVARLPYWYGGYLAVTYAALPLAMSALILSRHVLFLYAFGVECLAMIAGAFLTDAGVPAFLRFVHYGYAMAIAGMLLLLINKDVFFPFMFSSRRGWRQAPRIEVNQLVKVHVPRLERTYEMMIEDCSLTGLALFGYEDALAEMLGSIHRGELVVVTHNAGRTTQRVPAQFLWHSGSSTIAKIGLRAVDRAAMAAFFGALGFKRADRGLRRLANALWGKRPIRRLLNYVFAVAFLAVLIVPSLDSATRRQILDVRSWSGLWKPRAPQRPARVVQPEKKAH